MFFRFAAGLLLVVLVSTAGVRLEKQTLEMRRAVSVQYYQTDLLLELLVRLRLETQRLTAPAQLQATVENASSAGKPSDHNKDRVAEKVSTRRKRTTVADESRTERPPKDKRLPLLRFQHPFNPEGID